MHPQVKICGITNLADARYCASLGADYIGFIQHEPSPRYVEPDMAREIIEWVEGPRPVGVFVDVEPDEVNRLASEIGFDVVQLHGDEPPEWCREIAQTVVKVFRIRDTDSAAELRPAFERYAPVVSSFLLDAFVPGQPGGTGRTFRWDVAAELSSDYPLFLAGGLTPENVREAVERVRPVAVDTSSGVEEAPGRKSFEALDRFFEAIQSYTVPNESSD